MVWSLIFKLVPNLDTSVLSGMWLGVVPRAYIIKYLCLQEIQLHAHNMITIISSIVQDN